MVDPRYDPKRWVEAMCMNDRNGKDRISVEHRAFRDVQHHE